MLEGMRGKKWSDLTSRERMGVVGIGSLQMILLAAGLYDLRTRPTHAVRGSKRMWTPIMFINFIGPGAYFLFGRKR